jgi:hypothetical protein
VYRKTPVDEAHMALTVSAPGSTMVLPACFWTTFTQYAPSTRSVYLRPQPSPRQLLVLYNRHMIVHKISIRERSNLQAFSGSAQRSRWHARRRDQMIPVLPLVLDHSSCVSVCYVAVGVLIGPGAWASKREATRVFVI